MKITMKRPAQVLTLVFMVEFMAGGIACGQSDRITFTPTPRSTLAPLPTPETTSATPPRVPHRYCPDILPTDPKASLQPLAPGFTWTYRVEVNGEPKSLRWFTEDFVSGVGFVATGLNTPMDNVKTGDFEARYTITGESKTQSGEKGKGCFYRVTLDDPSTGQSLTGDEVLYWGRWRYGNFSDLAITEIRSMGTVSKQLLETQLIYPPGTSVNKLHFRYLSMDILYDWPKKGEVVVAPMNISTKGMWSTKSNSNIMTTQVPAGSFQTLATTFEYDFSGYVERKIVERLYYSPGKGLVKRGFPI